MKRNDFRIPESAKEAGIRFVGIAEMVAGGRGRLWALVWPMVTALVAGLSAEASAKSSPSPCMSDTVPMPTGQAPGEILLWQGAQWGAVAGNPGDVLTMDSLGLLPVWSPASNSSTLELGCTDPNACNYNPDATALLAGSCNYTDCLGCTDSLFAEYTPSALIDDGSCLTRRGCTDPDAGNFEPEAVVDNESCEYNGIDLVTWVDGGGVPGGTYQLEANPQATASSYSNWTFYVGGAVIQEDDGRYLTFIADTSSTFIYASAEIDSEVVYSDTLVIEVETVWTAVPVVVDMPQFPEELLGTGIRLTSSLDTLIIGYDELESLEGLELLCDFSSGVDAVLGEIYPSDSLIFYSLNYLHATDTLRLSVMNTAVSMVMSMPAMLEEGESILNFVESQISNTTAYPELSSLLSNQLSASGYFEFGIDEVLLADSISEEIKGLLPDFAEMPGGICPSYFDGGFFDGGFVRDWPTLSLTTDGRLYFDNCGLDVSYSVQARTVGLDGQVVDSKTYIFPPELGIVAKLALADVVINEDLESDLFDYRIVDGLNNNYLTAADFVGSLQNGSTSIVVSRSPGLPFFDQSLHTWGEIGGHFPENAPYDLTLHAIDMVPIDVPVNEVVSFMETVRDVLAEEGPSNSQKAQEIVEALLWQVIPALQTPTIKLIIWLKGMQVTAGQLLVAQIAAQIASYTNDAINAQSYCTTQMLIDGKYYGTPEILIGNWQDNLFFETGVGLTAVSEETLATLFPWDESYYMSSDFEGQPIESLIGNRWIYRSGPMSENRSYKFSSNSIGLGWHPFVAYRNDRSLLQSAPLSLELSDPPTDRFKLLFTRPQEMGELPFYFQPNSTTYIPEENPDQTSTHLEVVGDEPPSWTIDSLHIVPTTCGYQPLSSLELDELFEAEIVEATCNELDLIPNRRTGVHGVAGFRCQPYITQAGEVNGTTEWSLVPSFPNLFSSSTDLGKGLGLPLDIYKGIWSTHAYMTGELLSEEETEEVPSATGRPLYHWSMMDTISIQPGGGGFVVNAANLVGSAEEKSILLSVDQGELEWNSNWNNYSAFVLEASPQSMRIKFYENHPEVRYTPDENAGDELAMLTIQIWSECEVPELLGEWRAVLKPTGGCVGQSTVTFDGYTYDLVQIGDQCWFAENLRSDNYRNGDAIPGNLSDAAWTSTTSGAQTVYGEGSSEVYGGSGDEVANLATYGRLYNWYAVNDARGLCPTGWHVPTDAEWTTLTDFLGGSGVAGHAMKSSPSDSPAWNGSNTSGFSALPGGYRYDGDGYFFSEGYNGDWWSSSPSGSNSAWFRKFESDNDSVDRGDYTQRNGFSVRCVRD